MSNATLHSSAVSARLEHDAVLLVECTIPPDLTLDEWRRRPERHLTLVPDPSCDHLHETTSRYDAAAKQLTFLLVCPECGTEKVVETVSYEPRYVP
jgi:hypothetical protein